MAFIRGQYDRATYTASLASSLSNCVDEKVWLVEKTHKTTTHNGQDSASAVRCWSTDHGFAIGRHFATKRYTQDKDDGAEDAFAGSIWRGMTTSSSTQTVLDVQSVHIVSSYFAHVLTRLGIYSRAAPFLLFAISVLISWNFQIFYQ